MDPTPTPSDQTTPQEPNILRSIITSSNSLDRESSELSRSIKNISEPNPTDVDNTRQQLQTLRDNLEALEDRVRNYDPTFRPSAETIRLMEELNISEQYQQQVEVLEQAGIITPENHEITAIDGKTYKMPTLEDIARMIEANIEVYKAKAEQGFTQLLLVPFGMSLDEQVTIYGNELIKKSRDGGLRNSKQNRKYLDQSRPVLTMKIEGTDRSGELFYYPDSLDNEDPDIKLKQGHTKQQLIDSGEAWQILLLEDMTDIPNERDETFKTVGNRTQIQSSARPYEFLDEFRTNPIYHHEDGLTVEAWLSLALQRVIKEGQVLDDWEDGGRIDSLVGCWMPSQDCSLQAFWIDRDGQALLALQEPFEWSRGSGPRPSVRIKPKNNY